MKTMDLFGKNDKTNREQRISSLLECAVICEHCILKDSLCDCGHCDESYDKYLEVNNKTEEEDLKESGFIDKEEVGELDDLDRLYAFKMEEGKDFKVIVYNQSLPETLKKNLIYYESGQHYTEIEGHDKLKLSELLNIK